MISSGPHACIRCDRSRRCESALVCGPMHSHACLLRASKQMEKTLGTAAIRRQYCYRRRFRWSESWLVKTSLAHSNEAGIADAASFSQRRRRSGDLRCHRMSSRQMSRYSTAILRWQCCGLSSLHSRPPGQNDAISRLPLHSTLRQQFYLFSGVAVPTRLVV